MRLSVWQCGSVAVWHSGAVQFGTVWQCGTLWQCGSVAVWQCGTVCLAAPIFPYLAVASYPLLPPIPSSPILYLCTVLHCNDYPVSLQSITCNAFMYICTVLSYISYYTFLKSPFTVSPLMYPCSVLHWFSNLAQYISVSLYLCILQSCTASPFLDISTILICISSPVEM